LVSETLSKLIYLEEVDRIFLRKLGIYLPDSTASHISRDYPQRKFCVIHTVRVLKSLYLHRTLTPSWTLNEDIAKQLTAFGRTVLRITFWGINVNENGESDIVKN
jgi:hypothetical protein